MKEIRLTEIVNKDTTTGAVRSLRNYYQIPVPFSGYNLYFKNKKDAIRETVKFSALFTDYMHDVNFMNAEIYGYYRQLWALYTGKEINRYFLTVNDRFEYLINSYTLFGIVKEMDNITGYLLKICKELLIVAKQNKQFVIAHKLQSIVKRLQLIEYKINHYGEDSKYRVDNNPKKLF